MTNSSFHFQQLADDNEANEAHIIQTENLSLPLIP
jgi:hypothetical protein